MDFVTGLPILTDWKRDSYNSILVFVDWLTRMVYYEPVKVTFNAPGLAKVIIDVVMRHHSFPDLIVTDRKLLFTSKFWSLLCYFLGIKQILSIAFYHETDRQTEKQISIMEAYLWAFVNFEQNDWARLLPMAEFAYNNTNNASIGYTPLQAQLRIPSSRFLWEKSWSPITIKNHRRTILQTLRVDDRLLAEPAPYTRVSETGRRQGTQALKLCTRWEGLAE